MVRYLCCKSNIHFFQLSWLDVGRRELWNNLEVAILFNFVQAHVVFKVDAVGASLVKDSTKGISKFHAGYFQNYSWGSYLCNPVLITFAYVGVRKWFLTHFMTWGASHRK